MFDGSPRVYMHGSARTPTATTATTTTTAAAAAPTEDQSTVAGGVDVCLAMQFDRDAVMHTIQL